jgi:hypothetical protein
MISTFNTRKQRKSLLNTSKNRIVELNHILYVLAMVIPSDVWISPFLHMMSSRSAEQQTYEQ